MITGGELAELVATRRWSSEAAEKLLQVEKTPLLLVDKGVLRQQSEQLHCELPDATIHYALKSNSHRSVAEFFGDLGIGFEISSEGELGLLLDLGISPGNIVSSNPLKAQDFIRAAYSAGVALFAFDSYSEIEKLSKYAPGSGVCVRLSVSNEGSEWPLSGKFGVETEQAVELLVQAKERGLEPRGIAFHVGSQCTCPDTWVKAIEKSRVVWESVESRGIALRLLNIGGGFPIEYTKSVPSASEIADAIKAALRRIFPDGVELIAEPGRALVGEAGIIVASVIAKADRDGKKWVYLDVGVFNGLMETIGGIRYPVVTENRGMMSQHVLAGPSCDGFDVISPQVELPDLEIGDRVYIMSAGAYTTAYASNFNGFPVPETLLV